jgi:archaetidylserine synthase
VQVNNLNGNIFHLIRLPDLVTLVNALLGFSAILMVIQSRSNAYHASILIVLAVMADGIDGIVARSMEYGELGEYLDPLADIISFGVAPAAIVYAVLGPQLHYQVCIIGGTFVACGILRLARFSAVQINGVFMGIPITTSGLVVVMFILAFYDTQYLFLSYGLLIIMLILSVLMTSKVLYPKIQDIRIIGLTVIFIIATVILFYLNYLNELKILAKLNLLLIGLYFLSPVFIKKVSTE